MTFAFDGANSSLDSAAQPTPIQPQSGSHSDAAVKTTLGSRTPVVANCEAQTDRALSNRRSGDIGIQALNF